MKWAYLITGTSRGLGKSLRKLLCNEHCIGINRTVVSSADIEADLSDTSFDTVPLMNAVKPYDTIVFISNAATVMPLVTTRDLLGVDIAYSMYLHYVNPAKICRQIIRSGKKFIIVNITSGAACSAHARLAAYSSSKAAMHRYIEILAKEEYDNALNLGVLNFDPGRMQTDMQVDLLRSVDSNSLEQMNTMPDSDAVATTLCKMIQSLLYAKKH